MFKILTLAAFLLPLSFTLASAQKVEWRNFHGTVTPQKYISLAWWSVGDDDFEMQTLEYSKDGVTFTTLGQIAVLPGTDGNIYQFLHTAPQPGPNYYRLVFGFRTGATVLSETIKIDYGVPPVWSYPNRPGRPGSTPRG